MGGNAVLEGVVEDLGNVLVAVVGVEEVETPILGAHDERPCSNGLGGIPPVLPFAAFNRWTQRKLS